MTDKTSIPEPYGYVWFNEHMEHRFTRSKPRASQFHTDLKPIWDTPPNALLENAAAHELLRIAPAAPTEPTYSSTQATNCAGCGQYKHTPLRIDAMGGYVCLTCIDQKLGSLLCEFGYPEPAEQAAPTEQADYELILDDHKRLVRELDVILNGEQGAASQASLCDIVGQCAVAFKTPPFAQQAAPKAEQAVRGSDSVAEVVMTAKMPNASPAWRPHKIINASLAWLDANPVGTKLYALPVQQANSTPVSVQDVLAERKRQDAQWGGPDHDDTHTIYHWAVYIRKQITELTFNPPGGRDYLIKAAALAIAAVESLDRLAARDAQGRDHP